MNQAQLADSIAADALNTGMSKTSIKWVLDTLGAVAQETLRAGGEIALPGIGKLSVTTRAARTGRNPRTGEALAIAAKKTPKFSAAKALKDAAAA